MLVLFIPFIAFSENFTAIYTVGQVYMKEGGSWLELYPGDEISNNAVLKLEKGAQAEFSDDQVTILVLKEGTYNFESLLKQAKEVKQAGAIPLIQNKLKSLARSAVSGPSAVGGVRAAEASDPGKDVTWFTEDAAQYLEDGKELLGAGKFSEAVEMFEYGLDAAVTKSEEDEVRFYLAYTISQTGNYLSSLNQLNQIKLSPADYYYTDLYLLKGSLFLESSAFSEASDFLSTYVTGSSSGSPDTYQSILLMEGIAQLQQGNLVQAKQKLTKAFELATTSEAGAQAKYYLDHALSAN